VTRREGKVVEIAVLSTLAYKMIRRLQWERRKESVVR
jgi:hypothetical protein